MGLGRNLGHFPTELPRARPSRGRPHTPSVTGVHTLHRWEPTPRSLTVDVGTVLPQELQGVRVVMLHRLRDVDDVHAARMVPASRDHGLHPRF